MAPSEEHKARMSRIFEQDTCPGMEEIRDQLRAVHDHLYDLALAIDDLRRDVRSLGSD